MRGETLSLKRRNGRRARPGDGRSRKTRWEVLFWLSLVGAVAVMTSVVLSAVVVAGLLAWAPHRLRSVKLNRDVREVVGSRTVVVRPLLGASRGDVWLFYGWGLQTWNPVLKKMLTELTSRKLGRVEIGWPPDGDPGDWRLVRRLVVRVAPELPETAVAKAVTSVHQRPAVQVGAHAVDQDPRWDHGMAVDLETRTVSPLLLDVDALPGCAVVGPSCSGKSHMLRWLTLQALRHGWTGVLIDPHYVEHGYATSIRGLDLVTEPDEIEEALRDLYSEFEVWKRMAKTALAADEPEPPPKKKLVVVDELINVYENARELWRPANRNSETMPPTIALTRKLVLEPRKGGIQSVWGAHGLIQNVLGKGSGLAVNSFNRVVWTCKPSKGSLSQLASGEEVPVLASATKGRGAIRYADVFSEIQLYKLDKPHEDQYAARLFAPWAVPGSRVAKLAGVPDEPPARERIVVPVRRELVRR